MSHPNTIRIGVKIRLSRTRRPVFLDSLLNNLYELLRSVDEADGGTLPECQAHLSQIVLGRG
jgi:hypothetical protein